MKSGNYNELLDKFYAGTASAEEINFLQVEGLINEQDDLYKEALNAEREEKMNWEFEDFMGEIPSGKVVAFSARRVWLKRILSAAALVAAIIISYIFWPRPSTKEIANIPVSNTLIDSSKELSATAKLPSIVIMDTGRAGQKIEASSQKNRDFVLNSHRKKHLQTTPKVADKKNAKTNSNNEDYLVIINGKPITNEAEAVAIARESLGMISRNLTLTVDELRPISQIKIKLFDEQK